MLIDYINKALSKAEYDKLEDGTFFGKIPECLSVLAFGKTLFECQNELRLVLEGWIIVKIRHGDLLPNLQPPRMRIRHRRRFQERLRVRMLRRGKYFLDLSHFHNPSSFHHSNPVAQVPYHRHIVGNKK